MIPDANNRKIAVCLENMGNERPDYIVYSAKQQETICRTSGAKVALDLVHLASVTPDANEFDEELSCLLPFVGNIHFADMEIPKHFHIPLGEGNLPLTNILPKIWKGGYRGPAIVEEFGGPYVTQVFIDRAVQFRNLVSEKTLCR